MLFARLWFICICLVQQYLRYFIFGTVACWQKDCRVLRRPVAISRLKEAAKSIRFYCQSQPRRIRKCIQIVDCFLRIIQLDLRVNDNTRLLCTTILESIPQKDNSCHLIRSVHIIPAYLSYEGLAWRLTRYILSLECPQAALDNTTMPNLKDITATRQWRNRCDW
jgi:hypothetical protein